MKGWVCLDTGRMFLYAVIHGNGSAGTTNVVVQRCFDEDMPHFGKGMILLNRKIWSSSRYIIPWTKNQFFYGYVFLAPYRHTLKCLLDTGLSLPLFTQSGELLGRCTR